MTRQMRGDVRTWLLAMSGFVRLGVDGENVDGGASLQKRRRVVHGARRFARGLPSYDGMQGAFAADIVGRRDQHRATGLHQHFHHKTARWVLDVMRVAGALPRAGTHFRIATAVIGELNGDQTHACVRCQGTGRARCGRARQACKVCAGRGMLLPSASSRADACKRRRPEFRNNLMGVYLTLLARLRRELARAMAEYVIAEQWTTQKPRAVP